VKTFKATVIETITNIYETMTIEAEDEAEALGKAYGRFRHDPPKIAHEHGSDSTLIKEVCALAETEQDRFIGPLWDHMDEEELGRYLIPQVRFPIVAKIPSADRLGPDAQPAALAAQPAVILIAH
jgi:hypothetical protein